MAKTNRDFDLNSANTNPQGITTDGTNIFVVDNTDDKVYVYTMSGTYVKNFNLNSANTNPFGITTDGTNIFVVDVTDDKVYVYTMSGTYVQKISI